MHEADIRNFLSELGLPSGDAYHLPSSERTFEDGAHYRIEVPTVNSAQAMDAVLDEAHRCGVKINRITETLGIFRHTKEEIARYVELARSHDVELLMSVGPRASYDTSASTHTAEGKTIGYRLRGQEQVIRSVKDVLRAVGLGVNGIVVYDEGTLFLLSEMKKAGLLPRTLHLKVSAHMGCSNPTSARILQNIGANSINPSRDLQLPMIAALRQALTVPLDIHSDNPASSGGYIRFHEMAEIVRLAAPVYVKCGNSCFSSHGCQVNPELARAMARCVAIVTEMIQQDFPGAVQSNAGVR